MRLACFLLAAVQLVLAQGNPLLDSLNRMDAGDYAAAARVLEQSGTRNGSDARSLMTLGVALTLAGRFDDAVEPLERAVKLKRLDEATLWLYACEKMSGIVTEGHAYGIRRPGQPLRIEGSPKYQSAEYPSEYASFVYNTMASAHMNARMDQRSTNTPEVNGFKRDAAHRFVALRFREPDLASAVRQSQPPLSQETDYAQRMTRMLQTGGPGDPVWLNDFGSLHLTIGRYIGARRYSTLLLLEQPANTNALLRRAWAAARMGDSARARADLETAARIDPAATAKLRPRIESDMAASQPAGTVESQASALDAAARAGQSLNQLIARARQVHSAFAAQRLIYEEKYAADRASFEAAMRAQPGSADVRANYARLLVTEADINRRAYTVEPRPVIEALRMGMNPPRELARALSVVDQALGANPSHVRALLMKAIVMDRLGRFEEGKPYVDRAMRLAPDNPEALRLRSEYLWSANLDALDRATALRTPTVEGVRMYDEGNYRVTETTYRGPSSLDRGRADGLDQAAREMRAGSRAALEAAIRANAGAPEGFVLQAESHSVNKRFDEARATLNQGLAKFPRSLVLHEAMVRLAKRTRDQDLEDDEQSAAFNLFESTAGPKLHKAWRNLLRTDWPAVNAALIDASRLDPTDARIPAYRAVMLEQQGQRAEAARYWLTALALEEARLSFDESPTSAGVTRSPSSLGLALALRQRVIGNAKDSPLALEVARGAAEEVARIHSGDRSMLIWRYLLPDPRIESAPGRDKEGLFRWAPNAATVAANARVSYGRALAASGDAAGARAQFEEAIVWGQSGGVNMPRTAGSSNPADLERDFSNGIATGAIAEAYLEMAKIALAQKDTNAALAYYNKSTGAKPSVEVQQQLEEVLDKIRNPNQPATTDPRRFNPFGKKKKLP
ncbi:MAG: tetratricopeptide repeat protein [Candidatus Solibacter sp.]